MGDYPRFQIVERRIDDAHRHYHGGGLVTFFLSLIDRWIAWRDRRSPVRSEARTDQSSRPPNPTSAAAT